MGSEDAVVLQEQVGVILGEFVEVKPGFSVDHHAAQVMLSEGLLAEQKHLWLLLIIFYC